MLLETFGTLLRDPNHWLFELLVGGVEMLVFDVIIGALAWPVIKRRIRRHDAEEHPVPTFVVRGGEIEPVLPALGPDWDARLAVHHLAPDKTSAVTMVDLREHRRGSGWGTT